MNWTILGISETKDKKAITAAYRNKLTSVNPEDRPEEFMALRQAYEEAMRLAEVADEPEGELGPVDLWVKKLDALYKDFPRRISVESWKELLDDDVCQALDTRQEAETAMLRYFMENYLLPQKVWIYLDQQFGLVERKEELYESFPRDFIDNVIVDGAYYEENLAYDAFMPGMDGDACEEYIRVYNRAVRSEGDERAELVKQLKELPESHPVGDAFMLAMKYDGYSPEYQERLEELCDEWPEIIPLKNDLANVYLWGEMPEKSLEVCEEILKIKPKHYRGTYLKAMALAGMEKYSEASECIVDLMLMSGGDQVRLHELEEIRKEWNGKLKEQFAAKLEENPEDYESRFELAWVCMQDNELEKAEEHARLLPENEPEFFRYHNLWESLHSSQMRSEEALKEVEILIDYVSKLQPDGTELTDKRIRRLGEMYSRKASIMLKADMEGAADAIEESLKVNPEDSTLRDNAVRMYLFKKQYEKALEHSIYFTEHFPSFYHGYLLQAFALYNLHRDGDAMVCIDRAMELNGSDLQEYLLKLQIFVRNDVFEQAEELLNFLKESGFAEEPTVLWCEADMACRKANQLAQPENDDEKKEREALEKSILNSFMKIEKIIDEEEGTPDWTGDFYFEYAACTARLQDYTEKYDRPAVMAILKKGREKDPDHANLKDYYAWLLKKDKKNKEALELYHELEKLPRRNHYIERQLAELYYDDMDAYADKSLHYYEILKEDEDEQDDAPSTFRRGILKAELGDMDGSEEEFRKIKDEHDDDVDGPLRLGEVLLHKGRTEEAAEMADLSVEIAEKYYREPARLLWLKKRVMLRQGKYDELAQFLLEFGKTHEYNNYYADAADVYLKGGMFKELEKHLKEWKHANKKDTERLSREFLLHFLTGDIKGASKFMKKNYGKYDLSTCNMNDMYLAAAEGNYEKAVFCAEEKLSNSGKDFASCCSALYHAAVMNMLAGNTERVRELSQELEEKFKEFRFYGRSVPLYLGHRAAIMGLGGRMEEARALLAEIREMKLCFSCGYSTCKDADLYETALAYAEGKYEQVLELCDKLAVTGPDDEDAVLFRILAERELKKK